MLGTAVPLDPSIHQANYAGHVTQGGPNFGVQGLSAHIQADIKCVLRFDECASSNRCLALLC